MYSYHCSKVNSYDVSVNINFEPQSVEISRAKIPKGKRKRKKKKKLLIPSGHMTSTRRHTDANVTSCHIDFSATSPRRPVPAEVSNGTPVLNPYRIISVTSHSFSLVTETSQAHFRWCWSHGMSKYWCVREDVEVASDI